MSKTKPSGLIHYEILFIMPNKFTDDEAQKVFKKVGELITTNEGTITLENYWGKKKFSYPINHEYYGYYGLFEFDLERKLVTKLNETLRLDKEVVRFMIVKKEVKSEEQIKKDKKIKEKIDSKKNEELEIKEEAEKEIKKTETKNKEEKKVDLKNLDEKIEDVLNIDNLL